MDRVDTSVADAVPLATDVRWLGVPVPVGMNEKRVGTGGATGAGWLSHRPVPGYGRYRDGDGVIV